MKRRLDLIPGKSGAGDDKPAACYKWTFQATAPPPKAGKSQLMLKKPALTGMALPRGPGNGIPAYTD